METPDCIKCGRKCLTCKNACDYPQKIDQGRAKVKDVEGLCYFCAREHESNLCTNESHYVGEKHDISFHRDDMMTVEEFDKISGEYATTVEFISGNKKSFIKYKETEPKKQMDAKIQQIYDVLMNNPMPDVIEMAEEKGVKLVPFVDHRVCAVFTKDGIEYDLRYDDYFGDRDVYNYLYCLANNTKCNQALAERGWACGGCDQLEKRFNSIDEIVDFMKV